MKSDLSDDLLIEQEVLKLLLVQMINDFNEFKMQFPCKIKEHNEINKDFTLAPTKIYFSWNCTNPIYLNPKLYNPIN